MKLTLTKKPKDPYWWDVKGCSASFCDAGISNMLGVSSRDLYSNNKIVVLVSLKEKKGYFKLNVCPDKFRIKQGLWVGHTLLIDQHKWLLDNLGEEFWVKVSI